MRSSTQNSRKNTILMAGLAILGSQFFSMSVDAGNDPYTQAIFEAYHDSRIVPPVCQLGSNLVQIPVGLGDARQPMTVVSKQPYELLSRFHEPEDLVELPYKFSSVEQIPNLSTDHIFDRVRAQTAKALVSLLTEARAQGEDLAIHSSFRSYAWQCVVFGNKMKAEFTLDLGLHKGETGSEREALRRVNTRSALPGASEHQLGTAVDLVTNIPGLGYKVEPQMDQTRAFRWLRKNAYRFGFVMSYPLSPLGPKEPNAKTGYVYEPWHWRYIGLSAATTYQACESAGMTTQEFLRRLKKNARFSCAAVKK